MKNNEYNEIKVIGFDLDQTLYPKSKEVDEAIQTYIYDKISRYLNCSLKKAKELFIELYQDGKGLSGSKTLEKLGVPNAGDVVQEALENADIPRFLKPNKENNLFLNVLKKKYFNLDLITGSNKKNAEAKLKKLNIPFGIWSHLITRDNGGKSDGIAYKYWLDFYPDYGPENFLYIGDRVSSDFIIPKQLGIKSILVNILKKDPAIECPQLPSLLNIRNLLL